MATNNTYQHYTAADIARYHNGQMDAAQMYAMEKQALEDDLLADAIDGYANFNTKETEKALSFLQQKITKTEAKVIPLQQSVANKNNWKKFAAAASIAAVAIILGSIVWNNKKDITVAKNDTVDTKIDTTIKTENGNIGGTVVQNIDTSRISIKPNAPQIEAPKTINTVFVKPDALKEYYATGTLPVVVVETNDREDFKKKDAGFYDSLATPTNTIANKPAAKPAAPVANDDKFGEMAAEKKEYTKENESKLEMRRAPANVVYNSNTVLNNTNNGNATITYDFATIDKAKAVTNAKKQNYNNYYFNYKVMDAQGNHIPFANITIPSDQLSTYSRVDGRFGLFSTDSVMQINIKAAGFMAQTINLNASTSYKPITLQEEVATKQDADVVVVGNAKQKALAKSGKIQSVIEEAEPIDGIDNYATYIVNNINSTDKPQGEVVLTFDVDKQGDPTNIKIDKSLSTNADEEAIRLLSQGPKWKAKKRKAKKGKVIIRF
jgi:hypothetical protein